MEEGDDDGGGCEGERPTEEARSGGGQEEGGRACSGRGSVEGAEGHDGGQAQGDGGKGVSVIVDLNTEAIKPTSRSRPET